MYTHRCMYLFIYRYIKEAALQLGLFGTMKAKEIVFFYLFFCSNKKKKRTLTRTGRRPPTLRLFSTKKKKLFSFFFLLFCSIVEIEDQSVANDKNKAEKQKTRKQMPNIVGLLEFWTDFVSDENSEFDAISRS